MRLAIAAALVSLLAPPALYAQDTPRLARSDVTFSTGWIGAEDAQTEYNQWHGSLFGGLNIGHYWTDNLKTEVEAGWLSKVKSRAYEELVIGNDRVYVQSDYLYRDLRLSVSQSVQFGRNAWIHPFLGAGVELDYLRSLEDRPAQQGYLLSSSTGSNRNIPIPSAQERETKFRAVPFVKGGFKMYVSERSFIVQEFKFGVGDDGLDHVLWKSGIGFDF